MVMTANSNLVLGRGEVYFDRFAAGTKAGDGEVYIGNTPGFSLQKSSTDLDRFTAYGGKQIKRDSISYLDTYAASLTTDNITADNLALWFGSDAAVGSQIAVGYVTETFTVKRGRFYQLGKSETPFGVRWVEPDYVFQKVVGSTYTTIAPLGNLIIDRTEGRFQVSPTAADIVDGDNLSVTFQYRSSPSQALPSPNKVVYGSMRFLATTEGAVSYFFPYVRIEPSGGMDLKNDTWQQATFSIEILKLTPSIEFFYALLGAAAGYTDDELVIIGEDGISLTDFPFYEDQLHQIVNFDMPSHHLVFTP